jgi:hypothetical protein
MTVWTVVTMLADGAAAAAFLILGSAGRQRMLMFAGLALVVAMVVQVGATLWHSDMLMSGSFLLGLASCMVGFLAMATRAKPGNRRR